MNGTSCLRVLPSCRAPVFKLSPMSICSYYARNMSPLSFIRRNPYGTLALLSLSGAVGTSIFYIRNRDKITLGNQTFQIPIRRRDPTTGATKTEMQRIPLIPPDVAERILSQNISSTSVVKDGIRWNWHTAVVPSNHPIEDANTSAVHGDYMFFGVFDGHSGTVTSQLLQHSLVPAVRIQLAEKGIDTGEKKIDDNDEAAVEKKTASGDTPLSYTRSWKSSNKPVASLTVPSTSISDAIRSAFKKLDDEIINAPVYLMQDVLKSASASGTDSTTDFNSPLRKNSFARAAVEGALNGSCALLAVLDTYRRDLHVACTGDSRAVAGLWDTERRAWSADVLTDDQTGLNPREVVRMQSEHPEDEKEVVIRHGRVLGGLQPTRAFGDARYKWRKELQEQISRMFYSETETLPRPPSIHLKTPPYVTAEPVMTVKEGYLPSINEAKSQSSKKMRFLILATDGLWDEMSSEDACALVAGHLSGLRGKIDKRDLSNKLGGRIAVESVGVTKSGETTAQSSDDGGRGRSGRWTFSEQDEGNIAKHLIRNALGGESRHVREMLSIPAPISRRFRDDISVIVIWWDESMATVNEPRAKL